MKQLVQSFADGSTKLVDVPSPALSENKLLIKSRMSLLSSGTEKMLLDFGKANFIEKAKLQPEKLKEVIQKSLTDGPFATFDAVQNKLQTPFPLGYSNVGTIIKVGKNIKGFKVGERVVSNGPHADIFVTTKNLCCKVPENVKDEEAAFSVLASIGLQGIRLAKPTLGETFLVSGLGLIGLLTAQLLKANGCIVLGIDPDIERCKKAESFGIKTILLSDNTDVKNWCRKNTLNRGVDGVIITASTKSSDPIDIAAQVCRKRGRIISIGVTGLILKRELFYKKELTFQISCSYGPGRYDNEYEEKSNDYPFAYVRWTEQRNFEAVLSSMESGMLLTKPLISNIFPFEEAPKAYELLSGENNSLGILFKYSEKINDDRTIIISDNQMQKLNDFKIKSSVAFIGAGNYASRKLIPSFQKAGAKFSTIASSSGLLPFHLGRKFLFKSSSTDIDSIFNDERTNTVVIATRHDSHSELIMKGLDKMKNIFVEKPLCINKEQLKELEKFYYLTLKKCYSLNLKPPVLMVGFNRRFAPLVKILKYNLNNIDSPKAFIYTCNAGSIPSNHWLNDSSIGGGRLIGEACHFVDLITYLSGASIKSLKVDYLSTDDDSNQTFCIQISFKDGSIGNINYFANGSKSYPKERLEVFSNNKIFRIDNFLKLNSWGLNRNINKRTIYQDKGQTQCAKAFLKSIESSKNPPIPLEQIFEVQRFLLGAIS